ncbi:MAG TPA: DUF58 domain-containing protein [Urbifossiella sp.]|jgi:uncharacterized protein (DUF58 family)|nr:DUF58 domain-containing protein [Urbifossiella sp.]
MTAHFQEGATAAARYVLAAPRSGPINRTGAALAARAGASLEFRDYRGYEPGDDLRHVDWNAFARSDQLNVKLYREEVSPHLDLAMDGSRSMALAESAKARAALALAGFFTEAAANAGYTHAGWWLGADAAALGDRSRRPELWQAVGFDCRQSPVAALAHAAGRWKPRGVRVLISDLLWDADPGKIVRQIADRAAATVVVQLLAEADVQPPVGGLLRLVDSETEATRELLVDAAAAARYRENLSRLQGDWHAAARAAGAAFITVVAEELLTDWRLDSLVAAGILQVA